jgi:cobalt-zinc-cadmium resistance protein CzcA
MIARLVSFALSQRFLIVIGSLLLLIWGAVSFQKLPIDAYPDLRRPTSRSFQSSDRRRTSRG